MDTTCTQIHALPLAAHRNCNSPRSDDHPWKGSRTPATQSLLEFIGILATKWIEPAQHLQVLSFRPFSDVRLYVIPYRVSAAKIRLKREVDSNTKKASARDSRPRQKKCHSGLSFKPVSYCCLHVTHHTCHYHYSRSYHVDNLAP